MTRLVRAIALVLGTAALLAAAFTQAVTSAPASTLQSGNHANPAITPIAPGLVPSTPKQTPTKKSAADNVDTNYDYINSCSLVPLGTIRKITGDTQLMFVSKTNGDLTTKVSDAKTSDAGETVGQQNNCFLTTNLDDVKVQLMIGITPSEQLAVFNIHYRQVNHDDNRTIWAERASTRGLPGADSAYMTYSVERGERHYQELLVHTKAGQTLEIMRANQAQLRQLAYEALRTLNGTRYAGK